MLSIDTIARVVVNASRSVAVPSSFDTGLLLIKDANFTSSKRLKSYASSAAAAVALLANNTGKLPQTDDSTAMFINSFSGILARYTDRNVLSSASWRGPAVGSLQPGDVIENGFLLWADYYDTQPEADRQAHKAMPIQVALTLAGSLESVVINVNVQL